MKVITVITDTKNYYFNLLKLSCALNRLELIGLVVNEGFTSNRLKDELLSYYLETVPDEEIIFFTDGLDAVFTAGEGEILAKYKKTKERFYFRRN